MRTPISHLPAAELIPPAEIPVMIVPIERNLRSLSEIIIPIEAGGNRLFRKWAFDRPSRQSDHNVLKFSNAAIAHEFAGETEITIAALLAADLENAFIIAHGFHETFAFVDGESERLLRIDVLASFQREQIDERVPMVWCAGDDRVHVIALHYLAKIIIPLRRLAVFGETLGRRF